MIAIEFPATETAAGGQSAGCVGEILGVDAAGFLELSAEGKIAAAQGVVSGLLAASLAEDLR